MSDQQISDRGRDAARVLNNPAYRDAMDALKLSIVNKWKECPLRDKEGQTLTLQMMRLADTFESLLAGYVEAGKLAAHKLEIDHARDESVARRIVRRVL